MPIFAYQLPPFVLGVLMFAVIQTVSLGGLLITRRWILPRINFHDGVNDAISGTVQAIGVFYGITVGLIAVGVWNTASGASDLVSREAAAIGALYRDLGTLTEPTAPEARKLLKQYTLTVIQVAWPAQRQGTLSPAGTELLDKLQALLASYEPASEGDKLRYAEALSSYNRLTSQRRLRLDAVGSGLSNLMWIVIWIGAAISIGVAYFFHLEDPRLHALLVALMAGFLALVIYMIVINDKPFFGAICIQPDSYQLIVDTMMGGS